MSFQKEEPTKLEKESFNTFVEWYPRQRHIRQKNFDATYLMTISGFLAINPGGASKHTVDTPLFYPVKYERN